MGSGYISDPQTKKFLQGWYGRHNSLPAFARASWDIDLSFLKPQSNSVATPPNDPPSSSSTPSSDASTSSSESKSSNNNSTEHIIKSESLENAGGSLFRTADKKVMSSASSSSNQKEKETATKETEEEGEVPTLEQIKAEFIAKSTAGKRHMQQILYNIV
jgi:hypothetical protein